MADVVGVATLVGLVVGIVLVWAESSRTREAYASLIPVSQRGTGVPSALDPVEISVLLGRPPERTFMLLMLYLAGKRAFRITLLEPLRVSIEHKRDIPVKHNRIEEAVDSVTGEVIAAGLVAYYKTLATGLSQRMLYYSRRDTRQYYLQTIARAWDDVTRARNRDLLLRRVDSDLLWLLLDEERSLPDDLSAQDLQGFRDSGLRGPINYIAGCLHRLISDEQRDECTAFREEAFPPIWDLSYEELMMGIGHAPGGFTRHKHP